MKHLVVGVLLVWFTTLGLAAAPEDRANARRAITLIGEDVGFLRRIEDTLDSFVRGGKMTAEMASKMRKEITAEQFRDALVALYETRLTKDDIAATIAYLGVPVNLTLYRDMREAHAELQGPKLQARLNELQARNAQVWQEGTLYFGSESARKIAGLQKESQAIGRECAIAALVAAQAKVTGRPQPIPDAPSKPATSHEVP